MRRFFVSALPTAQSPLCFLNKEESRHMFRVVKIAKGEEVVLFNGEGQSCVAMLQGTQAQLAQMLWKYDLVEEAAGVELWLYLCLLKQQAWSTALRMATELGVSHIVPVLSTRSINRKEKPERWQSIVLAATKQCGRATIPVLHPMLQFADACTKKNIKQRYLLSPGEDQQELSSIREDTILCIGPEGGFSEKEVLLATQEDWEICGIQGAVLRADTAVAASVSLLLLSSHASIATE